MQKVSSGGAMEGNLLDILIEKELSSITFVSDYVQLMIDDEIVFTLYNYPTLIINGAKFNIDDLGYRDCLCAAINKVVVKVEEVMNEYIKLIFNGGVKLLVSLHESNYVGPEIAVLTIGDSFTITW
jgi:predicted metallo-beta-lactamase superfamily hydrolase